MDGFGVGVGVGEEEDVQFVEGLLFGVDFFADVLFDEFVWVRVGLPFLRVVANLMYIP